MLISCGVIGNVGPSFTCSFAASPPARGQRRVIEYRWVSVLAENGGLPLDNELGAVLADLPLELVDESLLEVLDADDAVLGRGEVPVDVLHPEHLPPLVPREAEHRYVLALPVVGTAVGNATLAGHRDRARKHTDSAVWDTKPDSGSPSID